MKLTDLEPQFLRFEGQGSLHDVGTLAEAQGIWFNCPVCANCHGVLIAFRDRDVLEHQGTHAKDGRPTRWGVSGTDFADLTLEPSVNCQESNPACWHGFIKNGEVT